MAPTIAIPLNSGLILQFQCYESFPSIPVCHHVLNTFHSLIISHWVDISYKTSSVFSEHSLYFDLKFKFRLTRSFLMVTFHSDIHVECPYPGVSGRVEHIDQIVQDLSSTAGLHGNSVQTGGL